ncbi:MAG: SDR family oxidoreductase [Chloroflexi bacterium]|nr:SDR family oxidoreductase [Chloroflexota bacterium]
MALPSPQNLLDFSNQAVAVTGSGSGLGRGIAIRFAEAGAKVVVSYRASASGAQTVVDRIKGMGREAVAIRADATQKAEVDRLIAQTVEAFGRLDVMINNAGLYPVSSLLEMSEAEWDLVINANLKSVFLCTQAAARQMIAQGNGGSIINVSSIEAEHPAPGHSHYDAAKAGVLMHTRAAAHELGRYNIRVNAVSPGLIWAEGIEERWPDGVARWQNTAPFSRLGQPDDVADACLFLASPAARWITGTNLVVDGGVTTSPAF